MRVHVVRLHYIVHYVYVVQAHYMVHYIYVVQAHYIVHYIYVVQAHERSLNTDVLFGILKKVGACACMCAHLCM